MGRVSISIGEKVVRFPVEFHPSVFDEVTEATDWYENKTAGLGDDFVAEVNQTICDIADSPLLHGLVHKDCRAAFTGRFPYVIYYRILSDRINVIAVQHGHRNPRAWRRRA